MPKSNTALSELLQASLEHLHLATVPMLLTHLESQGHRYNKTSVYRALEKLESEEKICKQSLSNNDIYYELRNHHHDHLVCTSCHKVEAAECQVELNLSKNKFVENHHHLTVFGLCHTCYSDSN